MFSDEDFLINHAYKITDKIRKKAGFYLIIPFVLMFVAVVGITHFDPLWYKNLFLIAIIALFIFCQFVFFKQLIVLKSAASKNLIPLNILRDFNVKKDISQLKLELESKATPSHIRDTLLRWCYLGKKGETEGFDSLMDNASIRRNKANETMIEFHSGVNRITLKLGFLGTLIGLIMTFPPMKAAILALQGSDGEFKFVTDIAKAIEGNEYAILTTLIATGLSILMELISIRILENIVTDMELANNDLDEWNIVVFQPLIREKYAKKKGLELLLNNEKEFENKLSALNQLINLQVKTLTETVEKSAGMIAKVTQFQEVIAKKIDSLVEYENEYRSFISQKMGFSDNKNKEDSK